MGIRTGAMPCTQNEPTRICEKDRKRALEPRKLAEFIVVDRDVFSMPPGLTEEWLSFSILFSTSSGLMMVTVP